MGSKTTVLVVFLLAPASVLAGCVQSDEGSRSMPEKAVLGAGGKAEPGGFASDWFERAMPGLDDEGHNHRNRSQHQGLSTPNFDIVSYNPLLTDYYGASSGDYACHSTNTFGERRLTVINSVGNDVAFILLDTTDLAEPKKVGELVMANTIVYDVVLSSDQRYVVLGTTLVDVGPEDDPTGAAPLGARAPVATFRDACTGEERAVDGPEAGAPYASGVVLVDIANPRTPAIVDFLSFPPLGGHSVLTTVIDGREIVMGTIAGQGAQAYYPFMEILETPAGGRLRLLSIYYPALPEGGEVNPDPNRGGAHDGFLGVHPVTGDHLAYLADGGSGLVILDIDDPANPRFLSRFQDWSEMGGKGEFFHYAHSITPINTTWEGRHYTFLGEECDYAPPDLTSCMVTTVDTTDPTKPSFVGGWVPPAQTPWTDVWSYSPHYMTVHNRTLFTTLYHGGLWAIDVSTDEARRHMPSIGVFMPDFESPKPVPPVVRRSVMMDVLFSGTADDHTPSVEDVQALPDGTLVTSDMRAGLYLIRFDDANPAPSPAPWPLGYE